MAAKVDTAELMLERFSGHPLLSRPLEFVNRRAIEVDLIEERLDRQMKLLMQHRQQEIARLAENLELVSPLGILKRGYSITTDADGNAVRSTDDVNVGDALVTRVGDGEIIAQVSASHRR